MKKVFLLDDNYEFLVLMKMFVETFCQGESVATSSFEDTINHEQDVLSSDMAFLDINLGSSSKNGLDVYRWLKAHKYNKPVYFLTGHAKDSPEAQSAQALGDAIVLTKPIPTAELVRIIGSENNEYFY